MSNPRRHRTMQPLSRLSLLFAALILALLASGCSSTKIKESWEASDIDEPPAARILLVAMIKDPVTRRFFEQHFVEEGRNKGIDIIPSSDYSPNATDHDQKAEIVKLVKETGVDGVLLAQIKGVDKEYKNVPSQLDWYPDAFSSMYFYDYYYTSFRAIYRPGYIGSDNYFKMHFRYFSVHSEKMLWAGNTVTKNPRSVVGTIQQIADEVLGDLTGSSLVKNKGFIQRKLDQGDDA
ncbi:hypothetical protein [Thiolapillus brandeum]|nr:hypothetical protein [Thiolapillus brandeum]